MLREFIFVTVLFASQSAHAQQSRWILEPGAEGLRTEGNTVSSIDNADWTQKNAIWSAGLRLGREQYWQLKLEEFENGSVGVTTQDGFQAGYDLIGLLYNGGLTNGTAVIEPDFGPPFKKGDDVGVYANFSPTEVSVTFFLNMVVLGEAFRIPAGSISELFLVVSFEGPGVVTLEKESAKPPDDVRSPPQIETYTTSDMFSLSGLWQLDTDSIRCEDPAAYDAIPLASQIYDKDVPVMLRLSLTSQSSNRVEYAAILTVVNTMQFPLAYDVRKQKWSTPGVRLSTNLEGDFETLAFERWMNAFSFNPEDITKMSGGGIETLVIHNDDCVLTFTKIPPPTITDSPFS